MRAFLLVMALLSCAACDNRTCEQACSQYYGTAAGDCQRPSILTDGTSPAKAESDCTKDCQAALYNTQVAQGEQQQAGGYSRLENEQDALEFIQCILDKDYSSAVFNDTCEDLFYDCPWIKW
jgi:hypothetical protein